MLVREDLHGAMVAARGQSPPRVRVVLVGGVDGAAAVDETASAGAVALNGATVLFGCCAGSATGADGGRYVSDGRERSSLGG